MSGIADKITAAPYPIGTIATIEVNAGPSTAWPVVERVPGGWQSGEHHYPEEAVTAVSAVHARPSLSLGSGIAAKIATALDEAQAELDAGAVAPLPVRMHRGYEGWEVRSGDGGLVSDGSASQMAALIVSVVNREARQIWHARALLEMATDLQDKSLTQTANYIGIALIKGLAATWCPEDAA